MEAIETALAPTLAALATLTGIAATYRAMNREKKREAQARRQPVAARASGFRRRR